MNGKMKIKQMILSLGFLIIAAGLSAQEKEQTLKVIGNAIEGFTGNAMGKANAFILDPETGDTLYTMKRNVAMSWSGNEEPRNIVTLSCDIAKRPGRYMIVGVAEGYDTVYQELNIEKIGSREFTKEFPTLVFYPVSNKLHEVSVTATKVKFYVKGDTIVYNADAFNIAEGSMLDVLIKQLPGVELHDDGEIYVNGKKVESLLLNGEDFFQGNRNIMLNNLGAYTVRNIEVYDKLGERSRLAGRNTGDGQYVMDVKLKKEYMSGWVGNIETGYGTADRYMGRLFGLWYTSRSRVALIGNVNNLNDSRTPGQNDSWQKNQTPGDFRTKMVGLTYNFKPSEVSRLWTFNGNTTFTHTRNNNISSIYSQNFLPNGDTYFTSYGNTLSHNLDFSSKNTFDWRPKKLYFSIDQNFQYRKNDSESQSLSGTFQDETINLTEELLRKVYSGEAVSFSEIAINTALSEDLTNGSTITAGGGLYTSVKVPHTPDVITISANGNYTSRRSDQFNRYGINYNREGTRTQLNQYIDNRPDKDWNIRGSLAYSYSYGDQSSASFNLGYTHTDAIKDSYLYDLDRLSETGVFGILPADYQAGFNPEQSYQSREKTDRYSVSANILSQSDGFSEGISYQILPTLSLDRRSLHYVQGARDETVRKSSIGLQFTNTFITFRWSNNSLKFLYERSVTQAPLNRMVDITNTRNPLYIYAGASDLKNSARNSLTVSWDKNMIMRKPSRHSWFNSMHFSYLLTENALTSGYSFDSQTGVRTYKIFNVKGNYSVGFYNNFYHDIGRRNQFSIQLRTNVNFAKESDMMSSEGRNFGKSAVKNLILG